MLPYRIFQPRGVSHGPDARRMGNPLSSGGIQFESILIVPVISILPWPRPYRFGMYPIYPILSYRRPAGGESYGLDNHLAAYQLAMKPKDKITLYDIPSSGRPAVADSI